jgi:hypothetical protein
VRVFSLKLRIAMGFSFARAMLTSAAEEETP